MLEMILWCAVSLPPLTQERPETLIRLTVDPMLAPQPALRYLLLPELREMTQGNPIPNYLKCLLDQDFTQPNPTLGHHALKQADRAARMDKPDWQILPKLKTDGISLLLPDLQKMRELAGGIQERFRAEAAARRFDDALVSAKTLFALARHTGEHPCLIGNLVALAIAQLGFSPLEDMLQQPGCPNLYWGLTHLPSPFISLEKGLEGERMLILSELRDLDDRKPMTPMQIRKLSNYINRLLEFEAGKDHKNVGTWIEERIRDESYVAGARRRVIEYGVPAERVAHFPAAQVILLDEKRTYQIDLDEAVKVMNLPTWEALNNLGTIQLPRKPALLAGFVPPLYKVIHAQGRVNQRIALLRHVEAIRIHAAEHQGKLPERLADIGVPLPIDPFTGKPFRYEVIEGVAHLRGTPPTGGENNAALNIHYEITIRK